MTDRLCCTSAFKYCCLKLPLFLQYPALIAMSIVLYLLFFLVISQILVRWPFPMCSRQRMRRRQRMCGQPRMHGRPRIAWPVGGINLRSRHFCFGACPVHTLFYGAVIVDLFIVILTATLREIAAVFVMLGCCGSRNKMYKCSCWVSLFLYSCAPVFCYCFVNCKCNHRLFITNGWHTFRYDATGKIITICNHM